MKLHHLLSAYEFDEIMPVIVEMFPGTGKHRKSLQAAYDLALSIKPVFSKKSIRYKVLRDADSNLSYLGTEDYNFNAPWDVCLGKEVTRDKGVDLSDIEMAANCLVNLCFNAKAPKAFEPYLAQLRK